MYRCELSDHLSAKINELSKAIEASSLWTDRPDLVDAVLGESVPPTLLRLVGGVAALRARVPTSYLKALFSARLSAQYVYSGTNLLAECPEFSFFSFVSSMKAATAAAAAAAAAAVAAAPNASK